MKSKLLMAGIICPLFFIAFFATTASAQKIKIGIQAGGNYSGLLAYPKSNLIYYIEPRGIGGGQANLFLEKQFGTRPFSVSAEPGMVSKGYNALVGSQRSTFRLTYANLPLVFNYYPVKRLGLSIGPELNYMLATTINGTKNQFALENQHRFEVAGLIGAQYQIAKHLTVGTRFAGGITPVQKTVLTDAEGKTLAKAVWRNMTGQVFVRYVI